MGGPKGTIFGVENRKPKIGIVRVLQDRIVSGEDRARELVGVLTMIREGLGLWGPWRSYWVSSIDVGWSLHPHGGWLPVSVLGGVTHLGNVGPSSKGRPCVLLILLTLVVNIHHLLLIFLKIKRRWWMLEVEIRRRRAHKRMDPVCGYAHLVFSERRGSLGLFVFSRRVVFRNEERAAHLACFGVMELIHRELT